MTIEDYDVKIKKISQWESFCLIPGIVLNVMPHRAAVDESRPLLSLLFRVGVLLLGIFGIVMFEVWKFLLRRERKSLLNSVPPRAEDIQYPRAQDRT